MVLYGKEQEDWLCKYLSLPNGIPSHDTFNRVFQLLDPAALKACLVADGQALLDTVADGLISLDGKKIRSESPKSKGNKGLFILSAWVDEYRLCIGQEKVADKSSEITAIPELLEGTDIAGATVSIDAIGCQKEVAESVVAKEGDYLLSLKANQGDLWQEVTEAFQYFPLPTAPDQNWEYDHGRFEVRICSVLDAKQSLSPDLQVEWKGIEQLVRIQA